MALVERDEERGLWLPVAGFHEMKTYLMQTRSSPTALSPPLLPHYLDPGVHKFSKGYLSPFEPSISSHAPSASNRHSRARVLT